MSAGPSVTAVIPTFNRAHLVRDAVDSVLLQTFSDLELIVVDDGSEDGTAELLGTYGPRIAMIRRASPSGSPAAPLNDAFARARGTFVALLDSDDRWLPHKLATQIPLFDDSGIAFVYGNTLHVLPDGREVGPMQMPGRMPAGDVLRALARNMFIHPSTLVVRRSALDRVGGLSLDSGMAEHYDLVLRLAQLGHAGCVRDPVTIVRRHNAQSTAAGSLSPYIGAIVSLERLLARGAPLPVRITARRTVAKHHIYLSRALVQRGHYGEARAHAVRAFRACPWSIAAWAEFGRLAWPK